jgi:hypothetical protein
MARLLDRVRSPAGSPPCAGAAERPQPAENKRVPDSASPAEQEVPVVIQRPANLTELTRRAVGPEKGVDLSAMRELANSSAKAAIERHARNLLARTGGSKLLMAILGATCGGSLYWMGTLHENGGFAIQAAAVSFVIALFWALQYAAVTGRLLVTRSDQASRGTAPAEHVETLVDAEEKDGGDA